MITFGNENDDDRDIENPDDPDAIPEQPDRYAEFDMQNLNIKAGGNSKFVMNESATESDEDSEEEESDEEEDFSNFNNYSSNKNKKDIDIDAI